MTTERRKAAIAAYKERKAAVGVYAVRCAPAGWSGSARPATSTRCGIGSRFRCEPAPIRAATCRRRGTRTAARASPSNRWKCSRTNARLRPAIGARRADSLLAREAGGAGPLKRSTSTQNLGAPSTALRAVPLPRFAREDDDSVRVGDRHRGLRCCNFILTRG